MINSYKRRHRQIGRLFSYYSCVKLMTMRKDGKWVYDYEIWDEYFRKLREEQREESEENK